MSTQALTIRIGADSSGAISVISQTTERVNQLGQAGENSNRGVASLTGGVQNLGRWSGQTTSAMASLTGGVNGLSRATLDAVNGTTRLNQQLAENTRVTNAAASSINSLKSMLGGLSVAFTARQIISEISSFETKLLSLKALTMANTEQMKLMEKQARELGATTAFSAQQAAEAQGVLASTGLKVNEILKATPQILQLAAAGSLDLAKAAEISMATMKGLGLQIGDLGHINDVFAKVAADSAINVEQIGVAMGEAAPSMRVFGVSLETTAAAIGILKDNGMKVGSIGDSLKSMMGALANETKENTAILERHNLTYKDLNVETLGIVKVLNNLKGANLSAAESIKVLGLDAFNATSILQNNTKVLAENSAALVKTSGDAQRQSEILNQGLSKAWDALKGSLSEAALQLGDSGVKGGLTDVIQAATGVIAIYEGMGEQFSKSNKLTAEQYENLKSISSELKVVAGGAGGIAILTGAIWAANGAAVALNATLTLVGRHPILAMAGLVAGVGGAVQAKLSDNQSTIDKQIETSEKRIAAMGKWGIQNMIGTAIGFDTEKERTKLTALKQFKEETLAASKITENAIAPTAAHTEVVKNHSKSLDANAESAGKSAAAHKALTDAQRSAKKEQQEYQHLIESTPYGEYNATVTKLKTTLDRVGEAFRATYSTGIEEANKKLLDGTQYVKNHTEALKEQQRIFEQTPRGKFEKSTEELRAQKPFMTENDYANKQDKIGVDYLHETGQNKEAKTQIDLASEAAKKYEEQIKKTTTANYELGSSSKMAFDGILGGISSVAAAFTDFGSVMDKNAKLFAEKQKEYDDLMKIQGATEQQKADYTKQFAKEKAAYDSANFQAEISGARSIAGATAKMFSEKSAGRKAFHAIEMGLAVVEMAMSAKKMVVDVAAGAANMFAQGGFAGFAGVAAMTAVMGGLGFAMSSGSKPAQDDTMKASATTGTVLGDAAKSSNSIHDIIQTLNDIHAKEYPELKATADAFRTLGGSVDGFIKTLAQGTKSFTNFKGIGIPNAPVIGSNNSLRNGLLTSVGTSALSGVAATGFLGAGAATFAAGGLSSALSAVGLTGLGATVGGGLGSAAGAGAMAAGTGLAAGLATAGIGLVIAGAIYGLGKLLGIGKTKITQLGEGFVINSVNMFQDGMEGALNPQTFAKWEAKTKGWFSDTKKIIESFGNLSDDMKGAILDIYIATKGAILASSTSLGLNDLLGQKILDYATPNLKIDWFKIKAEKGDVGKYISDTLNTMTDNIATDIFGNLLGSFQDMGEGMLQTIARLGSQYAIVSSTLGKYGDKLHATDMGMIGLSDSLVRMYSATGDAKEGLKNFIDVMNSFYDAVVPQGVKSQKAFLNMSDFSKKIGIDEKDLGSPDVLKAAIFDNFEKKKKLSDEAAIAEAELTKQREAVNNFYNPKTSTDLNTQLDPVWAKYSKTTDWANFQFSDLTNGFTEELVRSRALEHAGTSAGMIYSEIIRVAETNAKNKAAGLASGGNKWLSVSDLEASIAPLTEKLKTANENLAEVTALTPDLKEWEKSVTDLADNYQEKFLNLGRTDAEKIAVERAKILKNVDGLDFDFAVTKGFEPIVKAMRAAGIEGEINAKKIMEFTWAQEDAAKSVKKLADATKYFDGITQNIKSWIQNLKATQLGSPESQYKSAADNFAAQMKIINGGLATSAEEKQAALSGITGVADTFIAAIKNNYASTEKGQELIAQVVEQVSGLTTNVDVQQLQLGVLQQIRDGVHALPLGISDTQKTFFESLATKIDSAQKTYISAPTSQNDLMANTLAKEWTMAVDYATKGSGFLDAFIKSFDGKTGLDAAVNLIFSDKSLNPAQAQTAIDNVLSDLLSIEFSKVTTSPDFVSVAKAEIDKQIELISPAPIYLNANDDDALLKIKTTGENLAVYNGINVNKIVEVDVTSALTNINDLTSAAISAKNAVDALGIARAQEAANAATYNAYAGSNADITGISPIINGGSSLSTFDVMSLSNQNYATVTQEATKTFKDIYGASGLAKDISQKDLLKLADFAGISADSVTRVTQIGDSLKVYGKNGYSVQGDSLPMFAKGGAFTNGIVDEPTMFNMGMMGEAGTEMIMPATRMPDGGLGVRALGGSSAANDSSSDNAEMIKELKESNKELKEQNRNLSALVAVMQATLQENRKQANSLDKIQSKTRIQARQ